MSPAFSFPVGTLLTDYINAKGDTAFLSTPSPEMEAQAKAGAKGSDIILTKDVVIPLDDSTITRMKQQRNE